MEQVCNAGQSQFISQQPSYGIASVIHYESLSMTQSAKYFANWDFGCAGLVQVSSSSAASIVFYCTINLFVQILQFICIVQSSKNSYAIYNKQISSQQFVLTIPEYIIRI